MVSKLTQSLIAIDSCPYCSRSRPSFERVWHTDYNGSPRGDGGLRQIWAAYRCGNCGGVIVACGETGKVGNTHEVPVARVFPHSRTVRNELPPIPREYLRQAMAVIHAPDAAAVMAGSAVDAMLKHLGYVKGSLYDRIDQALEAGHLTKGMADWAHSVRLGSNRPRHADKDAPHVSQEDARRSVDFAEALGNFLFVLTAQIAEAVGKVAAGKT